MQVIYRPPIRQIPVTESGRTAFSERLGNWLPVAVAAALPVVFVPNLVDAYILPRASIAIAGACLGTGLALLVPNRPSLGRLRWPLLGAAAAALLAFAFSVSWPLSVIGGYTRYESLPVRLAYLGLLAVPVWLLRTQRTRALVVVAVILGAAVTAGSAISQVGAPFRPDGNLGNANLLGALIAMALPLCLSQMFRRGPIVFAAWACAGLMGAGLIVSTSRSGAIAALAGCGALAAFSLRGRSAVIAAGATGALVGIGLLAVVYSPLSQLNNDPANARLKLYPDAVAMVVARPLTGWGEEATGLVFGRFLRGNYANGVTFDRAHSGPLDIAATQGVLGAAATGWVLVVVFLGLWRRRFDRVEVVISDLSVASVPIGAIAAALVAYTLWVLVNFDWAPATAVFWLLAGTGWSAVRAVEAPVPRPVRAWPALETLERTAAALVLVAAAVALGALPLLADAWYTNGRPDLAITVDPLQAQYRRALGEVLVQQGREAEGLEQLRMAAALGETDPALYVELGDEELQSGNLDQARADWRRALEIDPYWTPAQRRLSGSGGGSPATA